MHFSQISDRPPVGVVDDVLKVVIGLFLGGPADDADGSPHLDVAAVLACQSLCLGDAASAGLRRVDSVEVHIRVSDREPASGLGTACVHHQRVLARIRPW